MNRSPERVEQFKQEIAGMKIRTPQAEAERWMLIGGVVAMGVGMIMVVASWYGASGTTVIVDSLSYLLSALIGLGLVFVGAALFVRYSLTRYLRYWLLRVIYEEQASADVQVAAIEQLGQSPRAPGNPTGGAAGSAG